MSLKISLLQAVIWSVILNCLYIASHSVLIASGWGINWYWVETARTAQQWEMGLMNRSELKEDRGMLFLFPEPKPVSFWMKSTLIPLDILFLDQHKKVINIVHHANPCPDASGKECVVYQSEAPAHYVLELKADQSKAKQILVGAQAYWILN